MKVLVLVNADKDQNYIFTNSVVSYLANKGVTVYLEEKENKLLGYNLINKHALKVLDFVIVLGGDGTIIHKLHEYQDYKFSVLGINLGRVGCLCEATIDDWTSVVDKVLEGSYEIEKRVILKGKIIRNNTLYREIYALNEVLIIRGERLKMLHLNVKVNNRNETKFYADGIIVATPTGSSAYSLSNGGPLLIPTAKSFVITPMCAQLKTITSLVVSSEDVITVSMDNDGFVNLPNPKIEVDGIEAISIQDSDIIELYKSNSTLNIIKINTNSSLYEPIFKVTNTFR